MRHRQSERFDFSSFFHSFQFHLHHIHQYRLYFSKKDQRKHFLYWNSLIITQVCTHACLIGLKFFSSFFIWQKKNVSIMRSFFFCFLYMYVHMFIYTIVIFFSKRNVFKYGHHLLYILYILPHISNIYFCSFSLKKKLCLK